MPIPQITHTTDPLRPVATLDSGYLPVLTDLTETYTRFHHYVHPS